MQVASLSELRGGELGSVNSNLERHARQDHMVRITRGNGCQARMPQRLSLSGMSRFHLGACLAPDACSTPDLHSSPPPRLDVPIITCTGWDGTNEADDLD